MSTKQTVEEAAKVLLAQQSDNVGIGPEEERGFLIGAKIGIEWQKEQGIEWIRVKDKLPEPISQDELGWTSGLCCVSDRGQIYMTKAAFSRDKVFVGWIGYSITADYWIPIAPPGENKSLDIHTI